MFIFSKSGEGVGRCLSDLIDFHQVSYTGKIWEGATFLRYPGRVLEQGADIFWFLKKEGIFVASEKGRK